MIEKAVFELMLELEHDYDWRFSDEEWDQTPKRVKAAFDEWKRKHDYEKMTTFEPETYGGMVIVRNIRVYAMCSHHLLPFEGKAHVAYIPKDKVYGASKLPRLVEKAGYQAQTQERMTHEILESIEADDAAVVIRAKHLCMTMRGIGDEGEEMITSEFKGAFEKAETRAEFLSLVGLK